jgi:hypothetical protein
VAGTPQDLTNYSFLMSVNRTKNPLNIAEQLFQVAGVVTDPLGGIIQFTLTEPQADQVPGKYFYDIQAITPSGKRHTIRKGTYKFKQDITKT